LKNSVRHLRTATNPCASSIVSVVGDDQGISRPHPDFALSDEGEVRVETTAIVTTLFGT